jgi:hypothetical protein
MFITRESLPSNKIDVLTNDEYQFIELPILTRFINQITSI